MSRSFPVALLTLAGLCLAGVPAAFADAPAPAASAAKATVQVREAWIGEVPPTARNAAAYLVLRNGARADALLGASTPVAAGVELHETRREGGLQRMQQTPVVELAPGQELVFAPGGRHLMLIGLQRPLQSGERIPLTLRFRQAGEVKVMAEVRARVVEQEHSHHGHHHH